MKKFLEEQNYLYYLGSKDQLNKNGNEMMFTKLFINTEFFHFWLGYLTTFELNSEDAKVKSLKKWSFYGQTDFSIEI